MTTEIQRQQRQNVPSEETWKLEDIFPTELSFEGELASMEDDVQTVLEYKGKLDRNAETLLNGIKTLETLQKRMSHLMHYAMLQITTDGSDSVNQARYANVNSTLTKVQAQLAFFETEILNISNETMGTFLEEEKNLLPYKKIFDDILEKKQHTLSLEVEETIAALGEVMDAPYMAYEQSKSSDLEFQSIKDEDGNLLPMSETLYEDKYEMSGSTIVRREAYQSFTKAAEKYKNTYAALFATEMNKNVTMARLRGYSSVTDMLLHSQQVTPEMYHNQLDTIQKELAPHMRRYAQLKQKAYGLKTMHFADLKAPLDPNYNPEISFSEAGEKIKDALSILGPEYEGMVDKALKERWIDYTDNIGKQSGAFCTSAYQIHPYILISWTNQMRGAFTLAHELGHAGHFYLAEKQQSILTVESSTYFVEAPSTFNELLLAEHLLNHTDDTQMKRWVIDQLLSTYYHNFITHLLEGEFQRRIYRMAEENTAITATVLSEQKLETIKSFWGDTVEIDEGAGLTWMRQPHYYMGLYPYTYSAGLTIATSVLQKWKLEGDSVIQDWLDVLGKGGSLTPLELTKMVGVDMQDPNTIKEAVSYVGSLVDQLEESY